MSLIPKCHGCGKLICECDYKLAPITTTYCTKCEELKEEIIRLKAKLYDLINNNNEKKD